MGLFAWSNVTYHRFVCEGAMMLGSSTVDLAQTLLRFEGVGADRRFPVGWSDVGKQYFRNVADGTVTGAGRIDVELAPILLKCTEGLFVEAEGELVDLFQRNLETIEHDHETFISALFGAFVVQRFDIVASLLARRFAFGRGLEIAVSENGPGQWRIKWDVLSSGNHRFTFDAKTYQHDHTRLDILVLFWEFSVYAHYSHTAEQPVGSVIINHGDVGQSPGLAFCDSRPDYFLIPDCVFVPSHGHLHIRETMAKNSIAWEDRKPVAFWRGATTGVPDVPGDWRTLERVRLCELARLHDYTGLLDIGLSEIKQFSDPLIISEIRHSGLIKGYVNWENWSQFKFLIEIDGNCNSWSNLFQRLLTGSTLLRVESPRSLNQWFYGDFLPWKHYIPIAPNLYDLLPKIRWLIENDEFAKHIGQSGRAFAEGLTYERELPRSAKIILDCFRYFNGSRSGIVPFGRHPAGDAHSGIRP